MASLLDIRRRIRAVASTQQITKAMKMVAASKLRRAQDRIVNARPFAQQMLRVLNSLATRADPSAHPLLARPDAGATDRPVLLVVISADKGLCGSFNTNIIKQTGQFIGAETDREVVLGLVGRKGRDFFARRGFDVRFEDVNLFATLGFGHAEAIARASIVEFVEERVGGVYLLYNEFTSILQRRVVVERLLPIPRLEELDEPDAVEPEPRAMEYLYEPAPERIFEALIPHHVEVQVYRSLLESAAAEHAARMTAMDGATKNSAELIEQLTLHMNKVRQASITREIIEVVSGSGAR